MGNQLFSTGVYATLIFTGTMLRAPDIALPCRQGTIEVVLDSGVGYAIAPFIVDAINYVLSFVTEARVDRVGSILKGPQRDSSTGEPRFPAAAPHPKRRRERYELLHPLRRTACGRRPVLHTVRIRKPILSLPLKRRTTRCTAAVCSVAVSNTPPAPATSGSGCRNLAIGAIVLLVVVGALGIVGAYYAYHSVKQKATAVLHGAGVVGNAVAHHDSHDRARNASVRIAQIAPPAHRALPTGIPPRLQPRRVAPAPLLKRRNVGRDRNCGPDRRLESYKQITGIETRASPCPTPRSIPPQGRARISRRPYQPNRADSGSPVSS